MVAEMHVFTIRLMQLKHETVHDKKEWSKVALGEVQVEY